MTYYSTQGTLKQVGIPHSFNMAERKTPEFNSSGGRLSYGTRKTVLVRPWAYAGSVTSFASSHQPVMMPLFTKMPEVSDINQQNIGDCAFLSSLAAVLATPNGQAIILSAMHEIEYDEEVKGPAVVVQLHDLSGSPHYIKLQKAVITGWTGNEEYHAKLDPQIGCWPVFFEAAFTAFDENGQLVPKRQLRADSERVSPARVQPAAWC